MVLITPQGKIVSRFKDVAGFENAGGASVQFTHDGKYIVVVRVRNTPGETANWDSRVAVYSIDGKLIAQEDLHTADGHYGEPRIYVILPEGDDRTIKFESWKLTPMGKINVDIELPE